jgi:hypothetical protein
MATTEQTDPQTVTVHISATYNRPLSAEELQDLREAFTSAAFPAGWRPDEFGEVTVAAFAPEPTPEDATCSDCDEDRYGLCRAHRIVAVG